MLTRPLDQPLTQPLGETDVGTEAPRNPEHPSTRAWLMERIEVRVAIAVGVAWLVLTQIAAWLEPATQRSEPFLGTLLIVAMDAIFLLTLVGLGMRRRWGLVASLTGAVLATAAAVACPTTGHHQFGTWWYGEMACVMALVAVSVVALRRDDHPR